MRLALVIVVALSLAPSLARGDARALYEEGRQHFDAKEYAAAITAWEAAYAESPAPLLLFNIGQAYRLDGDCVRALDYYDRYREAAPSPKNADELAAAEALCASARASTETPEDAADAGTEVDASTDAGDGSPAVTSGSRTLPDPVRTTAAMTRPRPRGSRGATLRVAGVATAAVGLASAGASAFFALRASRDAAAVEAGTGEWTPDVAAIEARGRRARTLSLATGAVGAAALVTGAVLYVLGRRDTSVEIAPTPSGATVAWRTHF